MNLKKEALRTFLMLAIVSFAGTVFSAEKGHFDLFTTSVNTAWNTNEPTVYSFALKEGVTVISATNAGGSGKYQSFTYTFPEPIDIEDAPGLMVKMKAWWNVDVRIDVQDVNGLSSSEYPEIFTLEKDGRFHNLEASFFGATHWDGGADVDLTQIEKVIFYFNADGAASYSGDIHIDNLIVGDVDLDFEHENFDDGSVDFAWTTEGTVYTLIEDELTKNLEVQASVLTNNSKKFQYQFFPMHFTKPFIEFDLQCDKDVELRVDLIDINELRTQGNNENYISHTGSADVVHYSINMLEVINTYEYYSNFDRFDRIQFYVNYSGSAFTGSLFIDNLEIGVDPNAGINQPPTIGRIDAQTIKKGDAFTDIDLADFISDADGDDFTVTVSGDTELSASITNNILSVATPSTDWIGSETLTIKAVDSEGNTNSATVTFTVEDIFPTGHYNNFSTIVSGVWETGNSSFEASIVEGMSKLSVTSAGGVGNYSATAYEFDKPVDMSANQSFSFKIKTFDEIDVRIDLQDVDGNSTSSDPFEYGGYGDGAFDLAEWGYYSNPTDATSGNTVDMSKISKMVFYVNADVNTAYSGDIYIDNILLGDYKPTYLLENFTDGSVDHAWSFDDQYTGTDESNDEMTFTADIYEGDYASISYYFPKMDLSQNPFVNISVKSDKAMDLRMDLGDYDYKSTNKAPAIQSVAGDGFYHNLTFDFTGLFETDEAGTVASDEIATIILMVNPGGDAVTANISLQKLEIGAKGEATANQAPLISEIPSVLMVTGDSPTSIDLSDYITDDNDAFADLTFTADIASVLSATITNGILEVSIADATWTGVEMLTLTAEDTEGEIRTYELKVRVGDGAVNPYGFVEHFDGMSDAKFDTDWEEVYDMTIVNEALKLTTTNAGGSGNYHGITIELPYPIDLTNNRDFSITLQSDVEFEMRMDLVDADGVIGNNFESWVVAYYDGFNGVATELAGTYSDVITDDMSNNVDMSQIVGLILYVNADISTEITADIIIDDIMLGNQTIAANMAPVMKPGIDVTIPYGQKSEQLNLNDYVSDETPDANIVWTNTVEPLFTISITDGVATIQPDYTNWTADEPVTFTATDAQGLSSDITFTFILETLANTAPTFTAIAAQTITVGETFAPIALYPLVSDETADADLTLTVSTGTNLTATISAGVLSVTAKSTTWTGTETLTITAEDAEGLSSTADFKVTILDQTNKAPVLTQIPNQTIKLGEQFSDINLTPNVVDETPDDQISWSVSGDENLSFTLSIAWMTVSAKDASWTGTETITLTAEDADGLTSSMEIAFTIEPLVVVNKAPVLTQIPNQTIKLGEQFSDINLTPNVVDETSDDKIKWSVSSNENLSFSFTTAWLTVSAKTTTWTGTETITLTAEDEEGLTSSMEITFTIEPTTTTNKAPVLTQIPDQTITLGESFTDINLSDYVTDETADAYIIWSISATEKYTVSIIGTTASIAVTNPNRLGSEAVTFTAMDAEGLKTSTTVTFTANAVSDTEDPVVDPIPAVQVNDGENLPTVDLNNFVQNDADADNLTFTVHGPAELTYTVTDGVLTIEPVAADWSGDAEITVTVTDAGGNTTDVKFTVTRNAEGTNSDPAFAQLPEVTPEEGSTLASIDFAKYVTDEELSKVEYIVETSDKIKVTQSGSIFIFSPKSANYSGTETVTVTATDEAGNSSSATFTVTVGSETVDTHENLSNSVNIYPNPANGYFNLEIPGNTGSARISLSSISGQCVLELVQDTPIIQVNLSGVLSGFYFVIIQCGETVYTESIEVE